MPDVNALYPAPPAAPAASSSLLSNPGQAIGLANGINQLKLFNAQFPALAQQPAAALQGQNISNDTAEQAQQEAFSRNVHRIMGGYLAGIPEKQRTPDAIRSAAALAARSLPAGAIKYPGIIAEASRVGQQNPGLLINSGLSPEAQSSRVDVTDPNTGTKFSAPVTSANLGGALPTSLPAGADQSDSMKEDLAREKTYATDIVPLQRALDLAQKLGPGGMAPGSKGRQEFESFVYGLAPQLVPASMQDKIKNYAELEKYLVNNASQRAQNLGPHTNDGLAAATTGSPNVHINDLAGVDLIKAQLALRKMEHAQTMQASALGGVNYTHNKALVSSQFDSRAFMIEHMTPDEIANLNKTLKGPERRRFNQSLQAAISSGVIDRK